MSSHIHVAATFLPQSEIVQIQQAAEELGYRFSPYLAENDLLIALGQFPPNIIVMGLDKNTRPLMLQQSLWRARDPAVVVYLTEHPEVSAVVAALKMGAANILGPHRHFEELKTVLEEARLLSDARSQWISQIRKARQRLNQLSKRQAELMQYALAGYTNQGIGLQLNLSVKTVEKHRVMIRHRTATESLVELERLNSIANRPLTAAYCLNAEQLLTLCKASDSCTPDTDGDQCWMPAQTAIPRQ